MQQLSELKGTLLFMFSCFFNFLAVVDRSTVTFVLGTVSSICVIVFYAIKIAQLLKRKRDVGKTK